MSIDVNPRGIPAAPYMDDVSKFVSDGHAATLQKFQEMHSKYRYMESHLLSRRNALESKIPELTKTLQVCRLLADKKEKDEEILTRYEVNDTLYANARIPPTNVVNLWLGANVMLEYLIPEAIQLLDKKLSAASLSLEQVQEDCLFLKEQLTTMEVNIARVYNDDVKKRRDEKK